MKTPQTIIITGASSGIGKATALALLKEGHSVFALSRRLEAMQDLKEAGATIIKMDICKTSDVETAVKLILEQSKKIDVLINNAGYAVYGSVEETPLSDAKHQFDVNLFGLAHFTQLIIPQMRAQNSGKIINMSSMAGRLHMPLGAWYHASKFAVEGWSDALRYELKTFGISVVIVEPGAIKTSFDDVMMKPLLDRSGNGPYAPLATTLAKAYSNIYNSKSATQVEVISQLLLKIIHTKNPKTRYIKGAFAKPMIWVRKWFGARFFDRLLDIQAKIYA